jgi:hypothetical protein
VLIIIFFDIYNLIEIIFSGFEFGSKFTPFNAISKESPKIVVLGLVSPAKSASATIESLN